MDNTRSAFSGCQKFFECDVDEWSISQSVRHATTGLTMDPRTCVLPFIDQSRNRIANVDHLVVERLANECHVPVRDVARAVAQAMDSIPPAHADIPHMDFVVESRARMRLFRASLMGLQVSTIEPVTDTHARRFVAYASFFERTSASQIA